ncbi:NAD-binding protein [Mesorhizobium sp. M7D.F.Ca.US.004.01.2.1]|nr:NAD-binding protein [Mesorhizobium sp. M7D.F.Ca.US.004.01.2.1]
MKLANNLLAAAALAISSEAVVMGVKAGLDPKVMIDVINASSGRNSTSVRFGVEFDLASLAGGQTAAGVTRATFRKRCRQQRGRVTHDCLSP